MRSKLVFNLLSLILCQFCESWSSNHYSRNFCRSHFSYPNQEIDKVPGGVGLSVLLVGGVAHANITESTNLDLMEETLNERENHRQRWRSWARSHLAHELLPVLISCSSDVVVGSQLLLSTPGVQEVLDVGHVGLEALAPSEVPTQTDQSKNGPFIQATTKHHNHINQSNTNKNSLL